MNSIIIDKIIKELEEKIKPGREQKIRIPGSRGIAFDKGNFHKIPGRKPEELSDKKIAFIDGGNAEIVSAPNLSVNFIRLYYTIYKNNKRCRSKRLEFYTLSNSCGENSRIFYKTEIFSENFQLEKKDLVFDSEDRTLSAIHPFPISKVGEIARRFAELKLAAELADELGDGNVIVLDGNLQGYITNEKKYLDSLYKKGIDRNILITALSKTVRMFTDSGSSVTAALEDISPLAEWYYHPVAELNDESYQADISFAKLNPSSKHIFKLEIYNKQEFNDNLFSILKENSKDPAFPGYPYGLIEADRFARISAREKEYLQTLFAAKARKSWAGISRNISAADAHSILDRAAKTTGM